MPRGAARRLEKKMTQAVVLRVKFPEGRSPEEGQALLNDVVIPTAKSQIGFKNGTWLHDGKGNGMGIIVFDTVENASAAQSVLKPPVGTGPELISCDLYEVGGQA
jgi:hypothetical protein